MSDGGNIHIQSRLLFMNDSRITSSVNGGPQTTGGNIRIDAADTVLRNSQIIANAYEGKGGRIDIHADTYLEDWYSTVSASSTLGVDGEVNIDAPFVNISGLLSPLTVAFADPSELLNETCASRYKRGKINSFVVKGRDLPPVQPGGLTPCPTTP